MPSYKNFFPSTQEYISACSGDTRDRNCIKFALGDTTADPIRSSAFNIEPENGVDNWENLAQGFLRTVNKHKGHLGFSSENFRRIASKDAELFAEEAYIFKVYGFDECTRMVFGFRISRYDFHVMRGLCSPSGEIHWEHKMGWERAPGDVTPGDLETLEEQYHDKFVYFAFTPPRQ